MSIDPKTLLIFGRAIDDTADLGFMLFDRQELRATIEELEANTGAFF